MNPFLIQLIIAIIMAVLAYALAPKPKTPKPEFQKEIETPTADAGRPVNVVFGDLMVKSPNCLGYWDTETKIKKVKA